MGGGWVIRQLLLVLCVWGKDAVGTRGETERLFLFKVVLNFVVSPSLQMKKWENFGARSHGHSARSRGHTFRRDRDQSKMLKGVVGNMHCLAKFSREAGPTPYIGHAQYIYACYLKSQISSGSPPSDCNLESVWSCQVDLRRDMPKACALALSPSL